MFTANSEFWKDAKDEGKMHKSSNVKMPTSPEASTLEMSSVQLCLRDPLAKLLLKVSQQRTLRIALMAFAIYGILGGGGGIAISVLYKRAGQQFLSILDSRELLVALFVFLVVVPIVWTFYVWQPSGILGVFHQLSQNGVIGETEQGMPFDRFMRQVVVTPFNRAGNVAAAALLTLIGLLFWLVTVPFSPFDPMRLGFPSVWWLINPFYFWVIWIPLVFVNLYMMIWVIIRQAIAVVGFTRLFRSFAVIPKPFHPDRCDGFACVGDYAMRSGLIAVLWGFWLSVMISFPVLFGQAMNLKYDTVLLFVLYVAAVPALLIPPAWEAHLAMAREKRKALEDVAVYIRELLSEAGIQQDAKLIASLLEALEKKYQLIDREYHTWPFRVSALKRFSAAALTPFLSTVASSLIVEYLK
jgi:hypothetical protein